MHTSTEILNTLEAAGAVGLSVSTLTKLRVFGGGPAYLKIGRAVRYRRADLETWLADKLRMNTSAA